MQPTKGPGPSVRWLEAGPPLGGKDSAVPRNRDRHLDRGIHPHPTIAEHSGIKVADKAKCVLVAIPMLGPPLCICRSKEPMCSFTFSVEVAASAALDDGVPASLSELATVASFGELLGG